MAVFAGVIFVQHSSNTPCLAKILQVQNNQHFNVKGRQRVCIIIWCIGCVDKTNSIKKLDYTVWIVFNLYRDINSTATIETINY
jgi:hypothetical protein